MPNVKLLVDVAEGGRDLAKARAAADAFGLGKSDPKYPVLKVIRKRNPAWFPPQMKDDTLIASNEPQFLFVRFVSGTVITMNDDGAEKWVDRGLCAVTDEPQTEYEPA